MWRYREILPLLQSPRGLDPPVTLGEGWTPLIRARRLGAALSLKRLYVKDESYSPTSSWKARGMSAALTRALHLGVKHAVIATSGRAGRAVAAYAARAGVGVHIFVPSTDLPTNVEADATLFGAHLTIVDGELADAERAAATKASTDGDYNLSAAAEPYRLEGQKTIGFEMAEQLGWDVPDWIICPAGTGITLVAISKAFLEMAALGWIDPVRRPHLVAVQAAGCAPLVRALGSGATESERWTAVRTGAQDLRIVEPPAGALVLRAIKEGAGTAIGVGDVEMSREVRTLAGLEGLSPAAGAGACLHAIRVLSSEGRIKPHDTVVILNPGTAEELRA